MLVIFFKNNILIYERDNFEDPITGITYRKLLPYGRIKSRDNVLAPDSMSLERHRLMWLFLKDIKLNFLVINLSFYILLQSTALLIYLNQ